jgi:hypothetical protein
LIDEKATLLGLAQHFVAEANKLQEAAAQARMFARLSLVVQKKKALRQAFTHGRRAARKFMTYFNAEDSLLWCEVLYLCGKYAEALGVASGALHTASFANMHTHTRIALRIAMVCIPVKYHASPGAANKCYNDLLKEVPHCPADMLETLWQTLARFNKDQGDAELYSACEAQAQAAVEKYRQQLLHHHNKFVRDQYLAPHMADHPDSLAGQQVQAAE